MGNRNLHLVCFSPTGTTRAILKAIGEGYGGAVLHDLTAPAARKTPLTFGAGDFVVLGAPVYGGRIPALPDEAPLFSNLSGMGAPMAAVVVYGNRDYDDAARELIDFAQTAGFVPAAWGAFIAEHTYSHNIASGRPDPNDLENAREFGRLLRARSDEFPSSWGKTVRNDRRPYRDGAAKIPAAPAPTAACTSCGICAAACPTGAIHPQNVAEVETAKCILCFACVKRCPSHAREFVSPPFAAKIAHLESICAERKEPVFAFLE